jgi:hypothetical protein
VTPQAAKAALDRFAPRPASPDEATADALIRYALVRAEAARALWSADLDAARQLVRSSGLYTLAFLLGSLQTADPAFADNAARRLWVALGDGGVVEEAIHAGLIAHGLDPEEIARTAVDSYRARAAEVGTR